jgi:hypothetical protein
VNITREHILQATGMNDTLKATFFAVQEVPTLKEVVVALAVLRADLISTLHNAAANDLKEVAGLDLAIEKLDATIAELGLPLAKEKV